MWLNNSQLQKFILTQQKSSSETHLQNIFQKPTKSKISLLDISKRVTLKQHYIGEWLKYFFLNKELIHRKTANIYIQPTHVLEAQKNIVPFRQDLLSPKEAIFLI